MTPEERIAERYARERVWREFNAVADVWKRDRADMSVWAGFNDRGVVLTLEIPDELAADVREFSPRRPWAGWSLHRSCLPASMIVDTREVPSGVLDVMMPRLERAARATRRCALSAAEDS